MDNFLTELYFKLFKNRENQKRLIELSKGKLESDNERIRNDQTINEGRNIDTLLRDLITKYMKHIE